MSRTWFTHRRGHGTERLADAFDQRVDGRIAALTARAHKAGLDGVVNSKTPLAELMTAELGDSRDDMSLRVEGMRRFILFCCQDGPHPAAALKNFYAVVHAIMPDAFGQAFGQMTCADYALFFGETKAAHSWRVKKIFSGFLKKAGASGCGARFKKSAAASRVYAEAQLGNKNGSGKRKKIKGRLPSGAAIQEGAAE